MPTHIQLSETGPAAGGSSWLDSSTYDRLARATVVLVFTLFLFANLIPAVQLALDWQYQPLDRTVLQILARAANALFVALVAATAITRLRPVRKAAGLEPRLSALLGTFLLMSLTALPRPDLPPSALAISSLMVIIGMVLSFTVLRWLGKSFSIMAEARKLVTHGPYAVVRHPLYICEEIAVLGIFIQVISPLALLLVLVHSLIQFRRMFNEENVLQTAFADYKGYAARTPRLIPRIRLGTATAELPAAFSGRRR
jgi:protein-S-isoprenylcysteine O-methyltransferase Ste14